MVAIIAALVLVVIGLANLWAVDGFEFAARQAAIAVAGVVLLAAFWRFRGTLLTALGWVTYLGAVVLLAVVHVAGETFNGATRWIGIGDFTFQPSELAKLGVLLVLAAVLGSQRPSWQRFVLGVGLAVVPITFTALQMRNAVFRPPGTSNVTSVDPPVICLRATAACGWSARAG